ncbi:Cystatin-F Cystatin-7 Cystatin-like metastasis-associated protein [Channa argus]|uniref:Cystatin-F Cystatin-7 Cystatin-like metastasis-associated protein n=1 Tax=Channa argus TaxID=215402 RepID=A0A6G1QZV6_CHAAH|nr:Cystatin-F Cystatin-7 Cystatin-like metastasis-associated protein [Channa argus]KAK2921500.1 hypothetical protein Q8A73_000985 [Channa argus]
MSLKTTLLLLLGVLERSLAVSSHHGRSMPGSPYNISTDDKSLQKVVLKAAYSFNNQSNDAFLFKPSAIHRAQTQVVKGIRYIVDFDISRTVCHKRNKNNNLTNCDFQPAGRLHQTFRCHFEMWMIPWTNENKIQVFTCGP